MMDHHRKSLDDAPFFLHLYCPTTPPYTTSTACVLIHQMTLHFGHRRLCLFLQVNADRIEKWHPLLTWWTQVSAILLGAFGLAQQSRPYSYRMMPIQYVCGCINFDRILVRLSPGGNVMRWEDGRCAGRKTGTCDILSQLSQHVYAYIQDHVTTTQHHIQQVNPTKIAYPKTSDKEWQKIAMYKNDKSKQKVESRNRQLPLSHVPWLQPS